MSELENLRRWKAEALPLMDGLQELGKALELRPGAHIVREATQAVKQYRLALKNLGEDRNTWARQMADLRDEVQHAKNDAEKAREMASISSTDRDNLCVELGELLERMRTYDIPGETRRHSGDYRDGIDRAADELRRTIARWEQP